MHTMTMMATPMETIRPVTRAQANAGRTTCATCHHRKVKCDAHDVGFPCSECRKGGHTDQCRLYLKRKRVPRAARARPAEPLVVAPAASPLATEAALTNIPRSYGGSGRAYSGESPSRRANSSPRSGPVIPASTPRDAIRNPGGEGNPVSPGLDFMHLLHVSSSNRGEYKRHLVEFIDQPMITERPIDKNARIMYIGSELSNINFLLRQQFGDKTSGVSHYPTNRIPRQHTCHEPDRLPVEAFQLPPKVVVDELLDAYFRHINPAFPIVDADLFMRQYHARDPQNPPSMLLLQSILVAGAHVFYDDAVQRDLQKSTFFRRAKILFDARFERNRDVVVQAALLLAWHTDGPEDVAANAWYWVGVAARNATGLGMHRDADTSTLVPHNKRMWRRVWWLLFQYDVLVSLQYGRPQSIRLEDSNVRKLKPSDFQDCGQDVRIDYVVACTELCIIISGVLRHQFSSGAQLPETRQARLQQLDETLAEWTVHLPRSLQLGRGATTDVWMAALHLHYNTALILLHRPLPCETPDCSQKPEYLDICASAAVTIQQIFQCLCERNEVRFLWCATINCLFTALVQLSLEARISNPILAVAALQRYESALSSLRCLADYWPNAQAIVQFFEECVRPEASHRSSKDQEGRSSDIDVDAVPVNSDGVQNNRTGDDRLPTVSTANSIAGVDWTLMSTLMAGEQSPCENSGLTDSWNGKWQQLCWHQPESTDDILFGF